MPMKYANGSRIGDGLRMIRVSDDGERFEIMTDQKTEKFSEVFFSAPEPNAAPEVFDTKIELNMPISAGGAP